MNHAIGIVIIFAAIGLAYAVYAASQLTISNNVTINVGINLKASIIPSTTASAPVCSASSGPYGEANLSMVWTVNQGASETRYVCIYNAGTVNDVLTFSALPSPLPNGLTVDKQFGICSNGSCTSGNSLTAGGYALVTIVLTASQTSQTGPATFTITIT